MTGILLAVLYGVTYLTWLLLPNYGWGFFFGLEALVIGIVLKSHFGFKKASKIIKEAYPDIFQKGNIFELLERYGVAIYTPTAADTIAWSFTAMWISGCVVAIIFLIMSRYVEGIICLANAFLAQRIASWLDPIYFMTEAAKKDPRYAFSVDAIQKLRLSVRQMPN